MLSDFWITWILYAIAGGFVGFVVGLTGVGGGSFMTPILVSVFGVKMAIAVGTDLLYAAITKANGVWVHHRQSTVNWRIMGLMSAGSLPAALATTAVLQTLDRRGVHYEQLLTTVLGVMLMVTATVLLLRPYILAKRVSNHPHASHADSLEQGGIATPIKIVTVLMGVALGVLVTLSSVGAGAFGAAVLMILYPNLPMIRVIGTDLAHAVPLTLIGGLGHMTVGEVNLSEWQIGHIDLRLLSGLLAGSLPAIWLGTKLAHRLSDEWIRPLMAVILLLLGVYYVFG